MVSTTDYTPSYCTTAFIRNFCTPPLDYVDVSEAELLAKIEAVESYCTTVFGTGNKVACSLLVLSKLIAGSSTLAAKYSTLVAENLGDYSYRLGGVGSSSSKSAFEIAKTWEEIALDMLRHLMYKDTNSALYQGIFVVND